MEYVRIDMDTETIFIFTEKNKIRNPVYHHANVRRLIKRKQTTRKYAAYPSRLPTTCNFCMRRLKQARSLKSHLQFCKKYEQSKS